MVENLYMEPYAEKDTLLNDFVERGMKQIAWEMFLNQEEWSYMSGELGKGRFPQLKGYDDVVVSFNRAFDDWINWLKSYMWIRYIIEVRLSNVDLGPDMERELRNEFGDKKFEEWDRKARNQIFDEYVTVLGADKATDLFNKAWPGWER